MSGSRISAFLICLAVLAVPLSAEAFTVTDYSVDITADASRRLTVSEDIGLYFTTPSHGIIRDIQYRFSGGERLRVSDISGTGIAGTDDNGEFLSVILGDPGRYITGPGRFRIGYQLQYPEDRYEDYDELYYNIVSPGYWDTPMDRVSFSVTFPFPVSPDRIWVTYGMYGSSAALPFSLSEDGLTVSGSYSSLPAGYGITLRVEMEDGYFHPAGPLSDGFVFIMAAIILQLAAMIIVIVMYIRKGRDEKLIVPVRFSPPDGFSPMDVQYLMKGTVDSTSVSAMLIYWADKGLLSINDDGSSYSFDRLEEIPDDCTEREKALFSSFFTSGHEDNTSLRASGFPGKLRSVVLPLILSAFSGEHATEDAGSLRLRKYAYSLLLAVSLISGGLLALSASPGLVPFGVIPSLMAFLILRQFSMQAAREGRLTPRILLPLIFFILFLSFFMVTAIVSYSGSRAALAGIIMFMAMLVVSSFTAAHISRRSRYGNERLREALGYREFIDKVEKDRIRVLSEEDPAYFYHVLPYAMVFGLADSWADKFRGIPVEEVRWYVSPYPFDPFLCSAFGRRWHDDYMRNIEPPRNTGHGGAGTFRGSSGFSGGGFSGGGGRSW